MCEGPEPVEASMITHRGLLGNPLLFPRWSYPNPSGKGRPLCWRPADVLTSFPWGEVDALMLGSGCAAAPRSTPASLSRSTTLGHRSCPSATVSCPRLYS